MAAKRKKEFEALDVPEIQMMARSLENDALGRYVANPANLPRIRSAFKQALGRLRSIRPKTVAEAEDMCPEGWWHHPSCLCIPGIHEDADGESAP